MKNITSILNKQASNIPNQIAIKKNDELISYYTLEKYVSKCAIYLYKKGLRKDDIAIYKIEDEVLFIIAMLASARLGATLISLTKEMTEDFLHSSIESLDVKYFISDTKNIYEKGLDFIQIQKESFFNLEIDTTIYEKNPNNPWCIIIGSGSTGKKKLIPETHINILAQVNLIIDNLSFYQNDKIASFIPIQYASTQTRFFETILAGATFVLLPKIDTNIVDFLKTNKISVLYGTVFHIEKLLEIYTNSQIQVLDFLRVLSLGSSKITTEIRNKIKIFLTQNLYIRYSTNEVGPLAIASTFESVFLQTESVGKVLNGVELEIIDDKGNVLSKNQIGHIRIKSAGMFKGYIDDDESTKKVLKDGWFYPGDMGKLTERNELIFCDRSDNMMIKNGINIYPSLIENQMLRSSWISEAIAFSLKEENHQDVPVCVVVLKKDIDPRKIDLISYSKKNLGPYSPNYIIVLKKTPRNPQGKIIKNELIQIVINQIKKNNSR